LPFVQPISCAFLIGNYEEINEAFATTFRVHNFSGLQQENGTAFITDHDCDQILGKIDANIIMELQEVEQKPIDPRHIMNTIVGSGVLTKSEPDKVPDSDLLCNGKAYQL